VPVPEQSICNSLTGGNPDGASGACAFGAEATFVGEDRIAFFNAAGAGGIFELDTDRASTDPIVYLPAVEQDAGSADVPDPVPFGGMALSGGGIVLAALPAPTATSTEPGPEGIWVTQPSGVAGRAGTEVARAPTGHTCKWPQVSPDGRFIVFDDLFQSNSGADLSRVDEVPFAGGPVKALTPAGEVASDPTFGPVPALGCGQVVFGHPELAGPTVKVPATYSGGTDTCEAWVVLTRAKLIKDDTYAE
jgi:hypothetical protein